MNQSLINDFLERIRQTESKSENKYTRFFTSYTIESTSRYPSSKNINVQVSHMEFRSNPKVKLYYLLAISAFVILVAYKVFSFKEKDSALAILGYVTIVILTAAVYSTIRDFYYAKTRNYTILVDGSGIKVGETFYGWKGVGETAILTKSTYGPSQTKYLIIAFDDLSTYEKYDLTGFVTAKYEGVSPELSAYIEHFKSLKKD